jgi:hypothetical protein
MQRREKGTPPGRNPAARKGRTWRESGFDRVRPLPVLGLGGYDGEPHLREARRLAFSQSIARLQQGSSAAATTLLKIMLDVNAPASTRVRAADSVLDHAAKAIEIEDIEARVAALEAAAKANQK